MMTAASSALSSEAKGGPMDKYQDVRSIPLGSVLAQLGFTGFKKRPGKKEHYGKCPFHQPKKNNTSFSFTDEKFNCFSCGEHGSGAIDLVMKLKQIGFTDAVSVLGGKCFQPNESKIQESGQTTNQDNSPKSVLLENKPFAGTYEKFYVKSEWLTRRGLTEETLKLFGVGQYRNPSRKSLYTDKVLFPVRRFSDGCKVGYLARTIAEDSTDPKYIFPKGFHKQLEVFGAWQIKQLAETAGASNVSGVNASGLTLPLRVGFVVESPLCVMKYWQMGFYAVSPWGAYVSEEQVAIIRQLFRGVIYLPDRDKDGQVNLALHILSKSVWLKMPELPAGIDDPEYLSREQVLALLKS
jgi:DNA primase